MLKQRIITALLMLAILLPAIFYPDPDAFALVALVLISAGGWEWARLNQVGPAAGTASAERPALSNTTGFVRAAARSADMNRRASCTCST